MIRPIKIGSGVLEQLTAFKQLQPVENLNHPLLSFFLPAIVANRGPSSLGGGGNGARDFRWPIPKKYMVEVVCRLL
jgi:hypothetical protein